MSRDQGRPYVVEKGDRMTRRRAALVAARAYATHPVAVGVVAPAAAVGSAVVVLAESWWAWGHVSTATLLTAAVVAVGYYVFIMATWILVTGVWVYLAPLRRGHVLWFVRTTEAAATLTTTPDRRRGALGSDVVAAAFAAWPRGRGAGTVLGDHVRAQIQAEPEARVTLAATPTMARKYAEAGFVVDGPQSRILPVRRMASRPRPPDHPDDEAD